MGQIQAITRLPGRALDACELSYLDREAVDPGLLAAQHAAYLQALEECGAEVTTLAALAGHPDALFVEDTAVVLDDVAVLALPGAHSRRGEVASVADALSVHRPCLAVETPGTLEGGDVCVDGRVVYVGQTRRTNHAGLKQMAHLVLEHGYMVKAVEVQGCLHLKSALCSLGDGRLLTNPDWVNLRRVEADELLRVHPDEPAAANVLPLGGRLICSSAYPRTNEMLIARGYEVLELELGELHKMEAAVTCPSLIFG